ncbi:MAG: exodeoxyribonuclease VII large subunit [Nitrospira sp. CR1.3]|nr:exodeoxyribonuclease VII large subunit [Nitrospira sp. CR1.3]
MVSKEFHTSSPSAPRPILTVSQLTSLVRTSIEAKFQDVWLEGEISNLRTPGSGHLYCTLKDETSQIRAVLFRSSAIRLRFSLAEGMQVIVRGRLTVYEPRGEYQIVLEAVEPKGIGALQLAFDQLKERLAAEGLFDPARKKPLPQFPKTVGIVTSLNGAAIRDILAVLRRRWPTLHIIIVPVQVQGEGAGEQIAVALRSLSEQGLADVIIVGRGGGSLEDLWSFNEEVVVRAVAASSIPIVAAVGHEINVTLTDFAADYCAPTPSVAAEIVVPVLTEVIDRLRDLTVRTGRAMVRQCLSEHRRLVSNRRGLAHIRFRIQEEAQRADDVTYRLREMTLSRLSAGSDRVRRRERELTGLSPLLMVKRSLSMMPLFIKRLERQMRVLALQRRGQVEAAVAQLNGLSPLSILGRGYSILMRAPGGVLLRRASDVRVGENVTAQLAEGRLDCTVRRVLPDPSL